MGVALAEVPEAPTMVARGVAVLADGTVVLAGTVAAQGAPDAAFTAAFSPTLEHPRLRRCGRGYVASLFGTMQVCSRSPYAGKPKYLPASHIAP